VQGPKKGYPKILFQKDSAKGLLKKTLQKGFDLFIDDKNINAVDGWTDESIEKILSFNKQNDSLRLKN